MGVHVQQVVSKHCSYQNSSLQCTYACSCMGYNNGKPSQYSKERVDHDDACEVDDGNGVTLTVILTEL